MWKHWERQVAKDLGGERTGPRGFALPDVLLDDLAPECKYSKAWPNVARFRKWIEQAKHNAGLRGQPWAIFFCLAKGQGTKQERYVLVDYDYFLDLYNKENTDEQV